MKWKVLGLIALFVAMASVPVAAQVNRLGFDGGVVVDTKDVFRGSVLNNAGVSVVPSGDIHYLLTKGDGNFLTGVTADAGFSEVIDSNGIVGPPGTHATSWFENDVNAGLKFDLKDFSIKVGYAAYSSPNSTFSTIQEVTGTAVYHDAALWARTGLGHFDFHTNPYVLVAQELEGSRFSSTPGTYMEVGFAPSVALAKTVHLSLPVRGGFSLDNYYNNGHGFRYAYTSVGPQLALNLTNNIDLVGGVDFQFRNSDITKLDHGANTQIVGSVGLLLHL